MYRDMVTLQIMDSVLYEVQRQGRISFYLTSMGEEAVNIASAAALSPHDVILPQVCLHSLPLHLCLYKKQESISTKRFKL